MQINVTHRFVSTSVLCLQLIKQLLVTTLEPVLYRIVVYLMWNDKQRDEKISLKLRPGKKTLSYTRVRRYLLILDLINIFGQRIAINKIVSIPKFNVVR